jgi:hypothetical protein
MRVNPQYIDTHNHAQSHLDGHTYMDHTYMGIVFHTAHILSFILHLSIYNSRNIHSISHNIRSSIYICSITRILSTSQLHSIPIRYNHSAAASFNHPPSLPNPKVKLLGYVFPTLDALRLACSITGNSMGH